MGHVEYMQRIRDYYLGQGYEKPAFALQVSRLTEAAYRSAARNAPVPVRV